MADDWSIVFRPAPRRILTALLAGARSLTELSEETGLRKPSLQPHLKELTALGAIRRDTVATPLGREVRYHLCDVSIHLDLSARAGAAIGWATQGSVDWEFPLTGQVPQQKPREEVTLFLRRLAPRVSARLGGELWHGAFVILYGSAARGEATWKSDLDLLVLLADPPREDIEAAIDEVVAEVQMVGPHALAVRLAEKAAFLRSQKQMDREIAAEGMVVWGPRPKEGEEVSQAVWARMKRYKGISI